MSLATPSKIRELQIKLYRKAKNEPGYRFYMLYDKIYREDVLSHAYELARSNNGAPGVDGQTFERIESAGLGEWLTGIRQGREREASVDGREGSPLRNAAGRRGQSHARQLVHEPFVEGLAEHQTGRAV